MPILLFRLNGVPDDEAEDIRALLHDNAIDYYETDVTLEELIEIMFEDLELPNLERRALREIPSESSARRKGYRHVGIRVRLDKRRTARQRVMRMLVPATTANGLEDYDELSEMYGQVIGQWQFEVSDVLTEVGGVYRDEKYPDQAGPIHTPGPRGTQAAAVRFLDDNVFATPMWLYDPEILRRIEPSGFPDRVLKLQTFVLDGLLNNARLNRLADQAATATRAAPAYTIADLLGDTRRAAFAELAAGPVPPWSGCGCGCTTIMTGPGPGHTR